MPIVWMSALSAISTSMLSQPSPLFRTSSAVAVSKDTIYAPTFLSSSALAKLNVPTKVKSLVPLGIRIA